MCLICSISMVSASDVGEDSTNNTLTTSQDDVVTQSDDSSLNSISDEEILSSGGGSFTELNDKINGEGSSVDLDKNYTYTTGDDAFTGGIFFTKGITIDGHGYTIDGNNAARIFGIGTLKTGEQITHPGTNGPVVLKNIRFINAYSNEGDQTSSFGVFEFVGINSGSSLLIENCTFLHNRALCAAAMALSYSNDNKITIKSCTFEDNVATGIGGGAIRLRTGVNDLEITDSIFRYNTAASDGGAMHIASSGSGTVIDNCTFEFNTAGANGGAILSTVASIKIKKSKFINNTAVTAAGAVYAMVSFSSDGIDNCTFINNSAKGQSKGEGGAVYLSGYNGVIKNSYFAHNYADNDGTQVEYGGGAITLSNSHNNVIDNCTFDFNTAKKSGGAILSRNPVNLTINRSHFNDNHAIGGGAILLHGPEDFKLLYSTFNRNTATRDNGGYVSGSNKGGAIYFVSQDKNNYILNCTFNDNIAARGGAIRCEGDNSPNNHGYGFKLYNSTFENNYAQYEGPGFSSNYLALDAHFENCTFIKCTSAKWSTNGGGLYTNCINSKFVNITIIGCSAASGGGWDIQYSQGSTFKDIKIINCTSSQVGGAVRVWGSNSIFGNVTISNCNVTSANLGGGAIAWTGASGILSNVNITNVFTNAQSGGAITWTGASGTATNINISNSRNLNGNGGAIAWSGASGTLNKVNITNANATGNGGAIYWTGARGTLNLINITKAISLQNGGAVYFASENGKILNSNFTNNKAYGDGGALYLAGSNQEIGNCIFIGNRATGNGGAIYVSKVSDINIHDSTFKNSYAYNGGAIYNLGTADASLTINNDTFIKNIASHNGGAIYYVVDNEGTRIPVIYRDYNNFDGRGVNDTITHRTSVTMESNAGATYANRIYESYFEDNQDYILNVTAESIAQTIAGMVNISNPNDINRNKYRIIINVTKDDSLVYNLTLNTTTDFDTYFNEVYKKFVVNIRNNLVKNTTYTVSVGFEDSEYLYKEAVASFTTINVEDRGDFHILQSLIDDAIANHGGVLNLTRSYEFSYKLTFPEMEYPDDYCMNISSPITINGNGWTINALGYSRIFNITANNVVLNNINFINGNSSGEYKDGVDKGGAIFWAGSNGVVNNSAFRFNNAEYGGGIFFSSTASDCYIEDCLFANNNATKNGGAIDCNASQMRLYNTTFQSNLAENGSALCREMGATGGSGRNNTFISNHATNAGAALAWMKAEHIYIDTYTFIDNTAGYSGGAIYVGIGSTDCTVFNCTFTGNNVTSLTEGHGGAIEWYADTGRILNSTFTENNAYSGGAVYVGSASGHINITNSGFLRNNAITLGGAIDLAASSVAVNNSYFRENTAQHGGAIFAGGIGDNNYIYSSYFTDNNATGRGGAVDWNSTAGHVYDTNFTRNSAEYGGAVYVGGASPNSKIENVIFRQNNASKNGGAIDWNATGGELYNTQFISNYAGEYGAALCREKGATGGSGKNNTFRYNHADIAGAALAWLNVTGIHINDYHFYYNTANASGGAIYIGNGSDNCVINGSVFEGNNITNETGGHGGAIDIVADNANITNSNFTNNNAFYGGAIFVGSNSGHTNIINAAFEDNTAEVDGGAINLQASGVTLNGTSFIWNVAHRNGGAVYVGGEGTTNRIYDSNFTSNVAFNNGGAIYWRAYAGHIVDSNFTLNSAVNGGAIYLNGVSSNTNITHVIFNDNNALKNGGAIDCNSTRMNLTYTLFENNYAGEYGAALCREQGATNGYGHHNVFNYNHAGIAGAALAWMNVKNINIDYYNFTGNIADQMGGAIYASVGSDNFTINHCNFKDNNVTSSSAGYGGAIDIDSDNNTIINSNFTNNNAYEGGAIQVGSASGHTNITNVTFKKNNAFHDGGAINLEASGVRLNDTRFYSNTAANNGGAVYVGGVGTTNVIFDSVFDKNDAGNRGGAIDWLAQKGEIKYSNFTNNTASFGGAVYLNGQSEGSELSHLIFKDNFASKNGGAIDCNAASVNLTHTVFTSNTAEFGAALCRESGATGGFGENNTFDKNHATKSGAALAWLGVSNIHINNYTFTNNTADYSGGAIYVGPGSDNCVVDNCTFDENYISNAIAGRGGAIDWIGNNGTVMDTTFRKCISINAGAIYVDEKSDNMTIRNVSFTECDSLTSGGALVLMGGDVTISDSNFTSSSAKDYGGAIAAFNSNNGNITNCIFHYNSVGIHIDPYGNLYGEGGAIYWENSKNITVKDSKFECNEAHLSGGSISANNCSDSLIYNIRTNDETAFRNGGSISWINSNNVTIDEGFFNDSGSNYKGGCMYFSNSNVTVNNTMINGSWASWGRGGAIYVDGNVIIENIKFNNTHADEDNASALYFNSGISKVINSTFNETYNSIGIAKGANVTLIRNNLTAEDPNKSLKYLEDNSTIGVEKTKYSIWNDGDLYLEKNNLDYVIFNNGVIHSQTYMDILENKTWNVTWNSTFTFFANITDDNNNSIISVRNLKTWNNESLGGYFNMSYNQFRTNTYYQANFIIYGSDAGLAKCTNRSGTINVKMPLKIDLTHAGDPDGDAVVVTATIIPANPSNYTLSGKVHFKMGDKTYEATINNGIATWSIASAEWNLNNLATGTHMVTATYYEDAHHLGATNETSFMTNLRNSWIIVHINNVNYGENATVTITTNSNGTIRFSLHGKGKVIVVSTTKKGSYYVGEFNLTKDNYTSVGMHSAGVVIEANEYYAFNMNQTSFEVYYLNTTIVATPTTPISVDQVETINVQLNESARGFVELTLSNGNVYYQKVNSTGGAQFNIVGLSNGTYTGTVLYLGDDLFNENRTDISFTVGKTNNYNITVKVNNIKLGENATIYIVLPIGATQNLTVYVNNTKYENVTVKDGLAIVNVNSTVLNNPGTYVVNVTYPGDSVYALKYNNGTEFNVTATDDWTLYLNVDARTYGQNTIFTVTVPSNVATRQVNLTIDGVYHPVTINANGEGSLTLNNLSGGIHTVVANYTGDERYVTKTNSTKFLINQAESNITLTQNVNGDIIATVLPTNVTGTVTFFINERNYTVDLAGNTATLNKNNLTIGNNSVVAVYNGDINFTSSKTSAKFPIAKNPASVNVTATNETYDDPTEITVKVPIAQKGYVTITVNDTLVNVTVKIVNGEAKFNATGLGVGRYIVNVTYLGDDIYETEKNFTYFNITKATLTPVIIPQNVTVKENASFVITVNDNFKGKVNITVNNIKQYDGDVESLICINKWAAGTYTANVTFYGDNNFTQKSALVDFEVSRVTPIINVTIDDVTYPNKSIAKVNVSDYANGTINITVGDKHFNDTIHNGYVEIDLTGLSAGVKDALVNFTTSDKYNFNNTSKVKFNINKKQSTVIITQDGQNVIATVPDNATGNVTFYINGKKYTEDVNSNGKAILVNALLNGNNTVVAVYSGDANFTSAYNATNNTVALKDAKVNVTAATVVYGNDSLITVKVPNVQKGYVKITVNGTDIDLILEINDGTAKFNASGLDAGRYRVNVTYLGDGTYGIKENHTYFNITKAKLSSEIIAQNVTVEGNTSFIINVTNDFKGKVNITVNGHEYYSGDVKSLIYIDNLPADNYIANVVFWEDDNYNVTSFNVPFTVSAIKPTINVTITDTTYPNNATATVRVSGHANGTIDIKVGSNTYSKEIRNGEVVIELDNLTAGLKEALINFTSSDVNNLNANTTYKFFVNKTQSHIKINSTPEILYVGDIATLNITVSCTGEVIVYIDGKEESRTLNQNRIILPTSKLTVGKHNVVVYYPGDNNYESSSESYILTVEPREAKVNVSVKDTPYNEVAQITVKTPINQTGYVTITVDGKNYTAKLVNGEAKFNVTGLTVDKYTVNVTYHGDENYTVKTNDTTFNVTQISLKPTVIGVNVTDEMNSTFVVDVPKDYGGQLTITVDGETYVGDVASIIQMAKLTEGSKVAHVVFGDDTNYKGTEFDVKFNVTKANSLLPVTTVVNGTTVVVTVPENVTGNVTVVLPNGTNKTVVVENGSAIITLENMTPGENNITVIYTDGNNTVTSNVTVTVPKYDTKMNATVSEAKAGGNATVTVKVPVNATGTITVTIDGQKYTTDDIRDGVATIIIENLTAGNKTLIAEYSGNSNYSANYTLANFMVAPGKVQSDLTVVDQGNGTVVVIVGGNATGNVTITLENGTNFTAPVVNGTAVVTLVNVTPGIHEVEVVYSGDGNHTNATVLANVTAPRWDAPMNVTVGPAKEGEPIVITVEVPVGATGEVIVYVGGENHTGIIDPVTGKAVVTVDNVSAGNHTIAVEYSGDGNYSANYTIADMSVEKAKVVPDMVVVDQGNGTVVVIVGGNATGNVTITLENGTNFTAPVVNGTAVVTLTNVTPGTHEIEVIYSGDNNTNNATVNVTVDIPKLTTPIKVDVSSIKVKDKALINVTVSKYATGNITIEIDGVEYSAEIDDGVARFAIENLTAGVKTAAVTYIGDRNYTGNFTTANFTVSKHEITITVNASDIRVGQPAIINVTAPSDVTRPVLVDVDGVGYYVNITGEGKGQLIIPDLGAGTHNITARYLGDDKYLNATENNNFTAEKLSSYVIIKTDNITVGDKLVIELTVPGDATGNVTVTFDNENYTVYVANGKGLLVVSGIKVGNYTIDAKYNGDWKYKSSDNSTRVEISKITDDNIKVIDQGNGTVVVVVPGNSTGNVTIEVGNHTYNATVINGTAVITLTNETPGEHNITVIYSGDGNHTNVTTNATVNIPKLSTPIKVDVANIKVGDKALINVTVPKYATGNITIEIDGIKHSAEIRGGVARFEIENLTAGVKTVAVTYIGDSNYTGNFTTANFTVSKRDSSVNATVENIKAGENVTVKVNVTKGATGQVLIDIDGIGYYVNLTDSMGEISIPHVGDGKHNITVTYLGDDKYLSSSNKANVTVSKVEAFVIPTAQDIYVGETEFIKFKVPVDATGNLTVVIDGEVYTFVLNEGTLGATFGEDEKYTVAISGGNGELAITGLPKGEYIVSVKYNGDDKYLQCDNTTTFKVLKRGTEMEVIDQGNGTVIVQLPENATGNVTITLENGTNITAPVINGTAVINLENVTPGEHNVTVTYSGDDNYDSQTVNTTVNVPKLYAPISITAHDIYVGDTETVTLTLPKEATGTVTIEINGKEYTTTVKDGKAVFNVNGLAFGDKTVAVKYSGDKNYRDNYTTGQFTVYKRPSTITAKGKNIKVGVDEIITANVPGDATGRVLVDIGGVGYYATISNGVAKVTIPELPSGTYKAKVTYEGDDKYLPSTTTVTFKVTKSKTPIKADGDEIEVGDDGTVTVKVPSDATGTVTIKVNGKTYTKEVKNGKAVFKVPGLNKGDHKVSAKYSGNKKYDANTTNTDILVHGHGSSKHHAHAVSHGIPLTAHATGNPIIVLLLILLTLGVSQIRRFKK